MKDPWKEWQEQFHGYEAQNEGTGPYLSSTYTKMRLSVLLSKSINVCWTVGAVTINSVENFKINKSLLTMEEQKDSKTNILTQT